MISDEKLMEVAAFVRSKHRPEHRDEAGQIAYLSAHKTRERYGHKIQGNPFTYLAGPAFMETTLELRRQAAVCSVSEKAARGRVVANVEGCFQRQSLFLQGTGNGKRRRQMEERFASEDKPAFVLRGELDRLAKVVEMFRALGKKERRLILLAVVDAREESLRTLAMRSKLARPRAADVLRAFAQAMGPDPSVTHLARVISRA